MTRLKRWAGAACIGALAGLLVFAVLDLRERRQLDAPLTCGHRQSWLSRVFGRTDYCRSNGIISTQRKLAQASLVYLKDHGEYPTSLESFIDPTTVVSKKSAGKEGDYQFTFVTADDGLYILASSSKHERVFVLFVGDEFSGAAFNKAAASTGGQ